MAVATDAALDTFRHRATALVANHPVVVDNPYTRWFARGEATRDEVRHLTVQFSVFSHLFIEAQLRKVINAGSLDTYRAGKEILLNELGVVFRSERAAAAEGVDPALVSTEGTVDGGRFRFGAAHFEWLLRFGRPLGPRLRRPRQAAPRHPGHARTSATSCCGSTARRIRRSPRARASRWSTGRPPGSGRSSSRASRCSRPVSARTCRWPSGPGTTRSRTSTRRTPTTSWSRPSTPRGSTASGSSRARTEMLDGVKVFWDGLERDRTGAGAVGR